MGKFDKYEQGYKYSLRWRVRWLTNFQAHLVCLVILAPWPDCLRQLPFLRAKGQVESVKSPCQARLGDLLPCAFDFLPSPRRQQPRSDLFFHASSRRQGHDAWYLESAQEEPILLCSASVRSLSSWICVRKKHNLSRTKWNGKGVDQIALHILTPEGHPSKWGSALIAWGRNAYLVPPFLGKCWQCKSSYLWLDSDQHRHSI